jgi:hypothetical protein
VHVQQSHRQIGANAKAVDHEQNKIERTEPTLLDENKPKAGHHRDGGKNAPDKDGLIAWVWAFLRQQQRGWNRQ